MKQTHCKRDEVTKPICLRSGCWKASKSS